MLPTLSHSTRTGMNCLFVGRRKKKSKNPFFTSIHSNEREQEEEEESFELEFIGRIVIIKTWLQGRSSTTLFLLTVQEVR